MVKLPYAIGGYFICSYLWLLVIILLYAIGGYFINSYSIGGYCVKSWFLMWSFRPIKSYALYDHKNLLVNILTNLKKRPL